MLDALKTNPFHQPEKIWSMVFIVPAHAVPVLEETFEDVTLAVSSFEEELQVASCRLPDSLPGAGNQQPIFSSVEMDWMKERTAITPDVFFAHDGAWRVEMLVEHALSKEEIISRLALVESLMDITISMPVVTEVQQKNWLAEVAVQFPPLRVGRFFVHGEHVSHVPRVGVLPIQVDAGLAFGSGEHATTAGCLQALQKIAKGQGARGKGRGQQAERAISPRSGASIENQQIFKEAIKKPSILDMGTGSGILAIGAARLWRNASIDAVDIDPTCVKVARENARKNQVYIKFFCGAGYASRVLKGKRYTLIIANILARPLMQYAKYVKRHLAPGGMVILSGLLESQANAVLAAHRAQGLKLKYAYVRDGWVTLVVC